MEFKNRNPKIYVIAGSARHGKDSLANDILSYYEMKGKNGINLQFSYYIKEYAKKITDWNGNDEEKPRELLQQLGTDLIRHQIDEKLFIRRMIEDIMVYSYFFDVITISDVRFDLELTCVKEVFVDAKLIKIIRLGMEDILSELKYHETEKGLVKDDLYDKIVYNDGSLEELRKKVYQMLEDEEDEY